MEGVDYYFLEEETVELTSENTSLVFGNATVKFIVEHEYVDLGLPSGTLWSTCNVGANSPEDYGDYFAWGETDPKDEYTALNYIYKDEILESGGYYSLHSATKYNIDDGKTELEPSDDAASVNWGYVWQTPSQEQYMELIDGSNTMIEKTTQDGVYGMKVTSLVNSKSIFFPAAGAYGTDLNGSLNNIAGTRGAYMSRTVNTEFSSRSSAHYMWFYSEREGVTSQVRQAGLSVRPIRMYKQVTDIMLSQTCLIMPVGGLTLTLKASILPIDATNKMVTWESSNESIATVDRTGKVTAVAPGTCVVTCRATDGSNVYAECVVTVKEENHEYVDLGLPSGTLWATCNVGANSPEEYGDYFAWGETMPKESYSSDNYHSISDKELLPQHDAATINWGTNWQMPSLDQIKELLSEDNTNYTTLTWTTQNDVNGVLVTSNSNGNSIFLPAAGSYVSSDLDFPGSLGKYWSRSSRSGNAYYLYFNFIGSNNGIGYGDDWCFWGHTIRPVYIGSLTPMPQTLSGNIVFTETEFVYSGQPFTPEWHFTNEAYQDLVLDEDYTVSWSNNVLPGTATLTITGKGNYTGTLTATFQIDKAPLRAELYTLTLPSETYVYDGQPHGAYVAVSEGVGEATITYTKSDETTLEPPTDAGTYTICLTIEEGTLYNGMEQTEMGTVTITPKPLSGELAIDEENIVYSGQPLTPGWHFTNVDYQDLDTDNDYTVAWSSNVLPGTATLTVTGQGNYSGSLTTTFKIDKAPLNADLYVLTLPSGVFMYDGMTHGASIVVSEGVGQASFRYEETNTWTESTTPPTMPGDYVIYLHITEGTLYYGTDWWDEWQGEWVDEWIEVGSFTIQAISLAGRVVLDETEFVYNGNYFTPTWHFSNAAYASLVEGTDYYISWSNNLYPGTGTLTVTGIGIYTGELKANIQIDKAPLRADMCSLSLPAGEYIYDEQSHGASIEVADGVGVATISYTENSSGATTAVPPTVPGAYDIYLTIADGDYYYGMEKTLMGHVNIKFYDEEKYMLAQQMASDTETYHMYYQTHQALTDFVDNAAAALASGDLHSVYVAFLPIDDRLEEAQASYEKYQLLADYIAAAARIQNAYSPFFTDEINASVRATIENLQTAYERGTLTNEEIREVWPQFQEEIRSDLSATFTTYIEPGNTLMSQGLIEDIHNRFAQALQEIQTLLNKAEYSVNDANNINGLYTRVRSLVIEAQANVSDLAILRQAYNAMGGARKLAGYWQFETAPYKLNGVTFNAGQATQITIENKNLTSGVPTAFFMLPKLNSLNLSHNNMTGNIAQVWQQLTASGKTSPLASLNISYNQFSGNIGLIGQVCTELRQLNASHNHLTECLPILCNNISNVDLSYQALDWTWNFMLDETQDNMQLLPQILRYDRQATDGQAASQSFTCTVGEWSMKLGYANEQLTVVAPAGQAYVGAKGTLMDATLTTSTATGSTFQLQFNFLDGDANFSGKADVLDLQSIINYMFNDWQRSAFNFTASNLYNDEIINVQDVVLMVEKLLSVNKPNNKRKNARTSEEENLDATDAYLYWSGNDLILNTVTGVTAADISFLGDASFTWELRQMGFTVTEKKDANGMHVVIYSLTGAEIPAGETVIARKTAGNAEPVNALFADHEAAAVSVCFSESEATPTSRLMATEGQWRIFRTDGTIVAYGTGQAQLRSASRRLTTGIYILQGENNKTQKFTIK